MNRYEEENGPFCSIDLKPIRQSEIPTDEYIRQSEIPTDENILPAPLVENDQTLGEHIAVSLAISAVIIATITGFIIPL